MEIAGELASVFPGLRVLELSMTALAGKSSDPALEAFKQEVQRRVRERTASLDHVRDQPVFRAYRDFFWRVGIDPTKTRPAGEALTRRILGGRDLPRVNTIVDAYNLASVETSIAIAAFDIRKVRPDALLMRKAMPGEPFLGIGMTEADTLTGAEVVIEDRGSRELIAVYPYRDSAGSKVDERTTGVLFMMCGVPGIGEEVLQRAKALTEEYVGRFCSAAQNLA